MRAIALLSLLAFSTLVAVLLRDEPPALLLQNGTDQPVTQIEVSVGGEALELAGLPPGASRQERLPLRKDGPLRVRVRFAGGGSVEATGGYFTPGMAGGNALTILSADSLRLDPSHP